MLTRGVFVLKYLFVQRFNVQYIAYHRNLPDQRINHDLQKKTAPPSRHAGTGRHRYGRYFAVGAVGSAGEEGVEGKGYIPTLKPVL